MVYNPANMVLFTTIEMVDGLPPVQCWEYTTPDTLAQLNSGSYFSNQGPTYPQLRPGDIVGCVASDGKRVQLVNGRNAGNWPTLGNECDKLWTT